MKVSIFVGVCLAFFAFSAGADELLVTPSAAKAKGGAVYAIDFVSSGEAVALQFNIRLPKGINASKVDLSRCVADLPKSHTGQCSVAKGHIIGLVFNDTNEPFAPGMVSIGKISIDASLAKSQKGLQISEFLVSDSKAKPVSSTVTVVE